MWLTQFIGSGLTRNVWQCCFDGREELFTVKVIEPLHCFEAASHKRLCNEFKVYLALEEAYQSGKLPDHITPECYGVFEGDTIDVLILELCDGILEEWDELSDSEW